MANARWGTRHEWLALWKQSSSRLGETETALILPKGNQPLYHQGMTEALRAFSLGYEGITLERYVELLKISGVAAVVDVREHAWSYKKGFSKKPLQERLESEGIGYVHLKSAGNPSRNRKAGLPSEEVIALYREHLDANSNCLEEVLAEVRRYAADGGVCLLCYERKPHECHRTVILDRLAEAHASVVTCHLGDYPA